MPKCAYTSVLGTLQTYLGFEDPVSSITPSSSSSVASDSDSEDSLSRDASIRPLEAFSCHPGTGAFPTFSLASYFCLVVASGFEFRVASSCRRGCTLRWRDQPFFDFAYSTAPNIEITLVIAPVLD